MTVQEQIDELKRKKKEIDDQIKLLKMSDENVVRVGLAKYTYVNEEGSYNKNTHKIAVLGISDNTWGKTPEIRFRNITWRKTKEEVIEEAWQIVNDLTTLLNKIS